MRRARNKGNQQVLRADIDAMSKRFQVGRPYSEKKNLGGVDHRLVIRQDLAAELFREFLGFLLIARTQVDRAVVPPSAQASHHFFGKVAHTEYADCLHQITYLFLLIF
ncbi:hypothetical protein D9M68_422190 [compost metagenome]